jgi:flavin reductase (DIM6/NTAB) family NADH-FMN oxidoreductase RutF
MDDDILARVASSVDPPVMIVTAASDRRADGCLVGFTTQCSIDPLRYLVCLSKENRSFEIALRSRALCVHVLHATEDDRALARLFGEETGFEVDKLAQCGWSAGPLGVPTLDGCDWFSGPVVDRFDLGDHVGFTIEVTDADLQRLDEERLSYSDVKGLTPGNPRSAN